LDTVSKAAGPDELKAILGDVDDAKVIEILKLQPSIAELEQAAVWAVGDGDVLARGGHPLAGKVAEIVEILAVDEEEPPPVR
jgi:hypothetical protein